MTETMAAVAKDGAAKNADGSTSAMYARPDMAMEITVDGELPELGGTAPAYRFDGKATDAEVTALAAALGVHGTTQSKGDYSIVAGPAATMTLQRTGVRMWSYYPSPEPMATSGSVSGTSSSGACSASPDGAKSCSGSGQAIMSCAVPPCPDAADCVVSDKCTPPAPPTRPADLPSQTEAERVARALLAKVGADVTHSKLTVTDQITSWVVEFSGMPVDGHEVAGFATTVVVGPKGAVESANGARGRPVKIGDYPLAGTAVGLERLKAGRFVGGFGPYPMAGGIRETGSGTVTKTMEAPAATIDAGPASSPSSPPTVIAVPAPTAPGKGTTGNGGASGSGTTSAGSSTGSEPPSTSVGQPIPEPRLTRPTVVVTGARLELALVMAADGSARLVPAYSFLTRGDMGLSSVPAVIDALLDEPAAQPVPQPMPMPMPATDPAAPVSPTAVPAKPMP